MDKELYLHFTYVAEEINLVTQLMTETSQAQAFKQTHVSPEEEAPMVHCQSKANLICLYILPFPSKTKHQGHWRQRGRRLCVPSQLL